MFRDSLKGLDRIFRTEPPEGSVVMVVGKPGTLKSSITHAIISSYLWKHGDEKAMYITIEESEESHRRNMASIGIAVPNNQYFIKDIASFEQEILPEKEDFVPDESYFRLIIKEISRSLGLYSSTNVEGQMKIMALDSLNSFKNLFVMDERMMRYRMQDFFQRLRNKKITSFIIVEGDPEELIPEYFMVDGIIEVGIERSSSQLPRRYLMVRKMRGTAHNMAPYMLEITEDGIEITEPLIGLKNIKG